MSTSDVSKRIVIEPVTRVEGHGKVTILLDDNGDVSQARLHIVEFRGFERFSAPFYGERVGYFNGGAGRGQQLECVADDEYDL